jgi:hypothetical protein
LHYIVVTDSRWSIWVTAPVFKIAPDSCLRDKLIVFDIIPQLINRIFLRSYPYLVFAVYLYYLFITIRSSIWSSEWLRSLWESGRNWVAWLWVKVSCVALSKSEWVNNGCTCTSENLQLWVTLTHHTQTCTIHTTHNLCTSDDTCSFFYSHYSEVFNNWDWESVCVFGIWWLHSEWVSGCTE